MPSLSLEDNVHLRAEQAGEVREVLGVPQDDGGRREWELEGRTDAP